MTRLILLIVLAAAVVALQASASETSSQAALPVPDALADVGSSGMAVATGTLARARYGIGRVGSFFVTPTVLGMAEKNQRSVRDLQPAINRTPPIRRTRIRDIHGRMTEADSLAAVNLHEGRPIAAVRHAMRGRGLLDAIRHQVVEETIR